MIFRYIQEYRNSSAVFFNDLFVNFCFFAGLFLGVEVGVSLFVEMVWKWQYLETPGEVSWEFIYVPFTLVFSWFNMLYKYCYYNPTTPIKICFTSFTIPQKYYPFLLLPITILPSLTLRYDAIFGLLFSIIECKFFNGGLILFVK